MMTLDALMTAYAFWPFLSFKLAADSEVMLETISTPGAICSVTELLTGPFLRAVILPGMILRALIFILDFESLILAGTTLFQAGPLRNPAADFSSVPANFAKLHLRGFPLKKLPQGGFSTRRRPARIFPKPDRYIVPQWDGGPLPGIHVAWHRSCNRCCRWLAIF
jgi:hypothetical protein